MKKLFGSLKKTVCGQSKDPTLGGRTTFLLLTALCSLLTISIGQSQWLETTIYVPDSLCGIAYPRAFTYNPTNNKIYVGGEYGDCVIVIDGANNQKIARIPVSSYTSALCYNSTGNKVYCANYDSDNVTVIDGANDSVITTITVGYGPNALVYNPTHNKVYCANYRTSSVTMIDGANDSVITTIFVGYKPFALVYSPINNKVYCANSGSANVAVIDGVTDSIITTIPVGDYPCAFTWSPVENRTYVANCYSSSISVIRDEIPGIEERSMLDAERLTPEIYPNPARSYLAIRWTPTRFGQTGDRTELKIFDVSGKLIRVVNNVTSTQENKEEVRVSLKGISPGIYFLRLGKETKKFLVVK